jgi:DnaJ family protein A protein 2
MSHTINITESLCGFKMVIQHLDGRSLILTHPAGEVLAPGNIRAIKNEGMPIFKSPFEKGNLYIKFDVKFPDNNALNEDAIKVNYRLQRN